MDVLFTIREKVWEAADWFRRTAIKVNKVPLLTAPLAAFFWGVADILQNVGGNIGTFSAGVAFLSDRFRDYFTKDEVTILTDYSMKILGQDIDELRRRLDLTPQQFEEWLRPKLLNISDRFNILEGALRSEFQRLKEQGQLTSYAVEVLESNVDRSVELLRQQLQDGEADIRRRLDAFNTETRASLKKLSDEVYKHGSWLDSIKEFFADPGKFILDRLEEALARLW